MLALLATNSAILCRPDQTDDKALLGMMAHKFLALPEVQSKLMKSI